tara:strand:- start:1727 stop:2206 length:480 start_codon:yes stop_codon:yes gene_type:complete
MSQNNDKFANVRYTAPMPALGKVGQYQMSAVPYASGSIFVNGGGGTPTKVSFPQVTRFVTIINDATGSNKPLRVGFSSLGVTGSVANDTDLDNYFTLDNGESYTGEWRVSELYMLGAAKPAIVGASAAPAFTTASVIAGLTGIPDVALSGNWTGSSGVG